jgi:hypothetical protein
MVLMIRHRDSFVGGYTAKLMGQKQRNEQFDIKGAVEFGCKAAARIIEYRGCLEPIVWADEVNIPRYTVVPDKSPVVDVPDVAQVIELPGLAPVIDSVKATHVSEENKVGEQQEQNTTLE